MINTKSEYAPIVLFTYSRPIHTQKVLDALSENEEAKESQLYIYCDGAKENASSESLTKIEQTRSIVKKETRFKEVIVIEQPKNKGLANSIIDGVTEIINKHGKIIVLEDDLVPSIGFLNYMNTALLLYENENKVSAIHAWCGKINMKITQEQTFFLKGADCWGWATWRRNWNLFNYDARDLYNEINTKGLSDYFNLFGSINYMGMLQEQIDGKIDSWAIRWQASMFLENKLCLHPVNSLIKNIGIDGSGTHCGIGNLQENIVNNIVVNRQEIEENIGYYIALLEQSKVFINCNRKIGLRDLLHYTKRFLLNI